MTAERDDFQNFVYSFCRIYWRLMDRDVLISFVEFCILQDFEKKCIFEKNHVIMVVTTIVLSISSFRKD